MIALDLPGEPLIAEGISRHAQVLQLGELGQFEGKLTEVVVAQILPRHTPAPPLYVPSSALDHLRHFPYISLNYIYTGRQRFMVYAHNTSHNARALITEANSLLASPLFDEENSWVEVDPLPFYSEVSLIRIQALNSLPTFTIEFARTPEGLVKLDGTQESIETINRISPPILTSETVVAYVKFVLSRLHTEGDSFKLVEHRLELGYTGRIHPLGLLLLQLRLFKPRVKTTSEGFRVTAPVLYLDHLYRAVIHVEPQGGVDILDEKVLLRKVPTRDIWLE